MAHAMYHSFVMCLPKVPGVTSQYTESDSHGVGSPNEVEIRIPSKLKVHKHRATYQLIKFAFAANHLSCVSAFEIRVLFEIIVPLVVFAIYIGGHGAVDVYVIYLKGARIRTYI